MDKFQCPFTNLKNRQIRKWVFERRRTCHEGSEGSLKYYQATYHQPPRYKEVDVVGPLHDRIFTMGVLSPDGSVVATATARNKKVAEQEASQLALVRLGVLNETEDDPDIAGEEEVAAAQAQVQSRATATE